MQAWNPTEISAHRSMAQIAPVRQSRQLASPCNSGGTFSSREFSAHASPAKTSRLQHPAFRRAPSAAGVSVSLRFPSAHEGSAKKGPLQWTGCGPATEGTGLGDGRKQGKAWNWSLPLSSAPEAAPFGSDAVFASFLGLLCMARTIQKQWRVYSGQRCASLSQRPTSSQ